MGGGLMVNDVVLWCVQRSRSQAVRRWVMGECGMLWCVGMKKPQLHSGGQVGRRLRVRGLRGRARWPGEVAGRTCGASSSLQHWGVWRSGAYR